MTHDRNEACIIEIESLKKSVDSLNVQHSDVLERLDESIQIQIRLSEKVTHIVERLNSRHPKDDESFRKVNAQIESMSTLLNKTITEQALHVQRLVAIEDIEKDRKNDKRGIVHATVTTVIGLLLAALGIKIGIGHQ